MAKTNFRKVMALLIAAVFVGTSLPAVIPAAEAAEKTVSLFSDDFGKSGTGGSTAIDDSKWTIHTVGGATVTRRDALETDNFMVRFTGEFDTTNNADQILYIEPASFSTVKKDKVNISFDFYTSSMRANMYHGLFMSLGASVDYLPIISVDSNHLVKIGNTATTTTLIANTMYTVSVTVDLTQEKEFNLEITQNSTSVLRYQETLSAAMGEPWASAYKNNGFSGVRWMVDATARSSGKCTLYYDNISVTTTEETLDNIDVNVSGNAKVGETLSATVTPANADVSYQWYRYTTGNQNGNSSATLIDGATNSTYEITTDDENHYIAVTATLKDDPNVNDTSATNDKATFVEAYPWVIDFNETINFSTVGSTKTVAAAGIRYTRSQEDNTIAVENGRDGTNAVKLSTAYGTSSNTDIRTYYQWAYLNEGIIKYTMDVKIPQELKNTAFNLRLGSTDDEGAIFNDVILGIDEVKYPINEWFTIQVTLYPETATYDCEFYLENSDVAVIAQGAEIAEKNEAFAERIKTNGLTNARITLGVKEEEFEGTESVIIDNIAVDVLENKINVPYIVIDGETGIATATLTVNEIGAKIFLALYDSNGNIKGVYLSDASTAESNALTATSLIALPSGGSAKAFLWNANTLNPLRAISIK